MLFSCSVMSDSFQLPMDCSMSGFPVLQYLPEFAQTKVHWVDDTIQPFYHLLPPSPPALNLSQHQGLFQWVGSFHQVAKVLELQLQHQSLPMNIQGWFPLGLTGLNSQESSPAPQFKSINSLGPSLLYSPAVTSVHDYWKNHSFDYADFCWQNDVSAL